MALDVRSSSTSDFDVMDSKVQSLANSLLRDVTKPSSLLNFILTLLENFKYQARKLEVFQTCDWEAAFVCFKTSEYLTLALQSMHLRNYDAICKNLAETLEKLGESFRTVELLMSNARTKRVLASIDLPSKNDFDMLSLKDFISPSTLVPLVRSASESILFIDFRSRKEFEYSHINASNVINVEPKIVTVLFNELSKPKLDDLIERLLLEGNIHDANKLRVCNRFELVVLYNLRFGTAQGNLIEGLKLLLTLGKTTFAAGSPFQNLIDLLVYRDSQISKAKRFPLILQGGMAEWFKYAGKSSLTNPKSQPELQTDKDSAKAYLRNFGEYLSIGTQAHLLSSRNSTASVLLQETVQPSEPSQKQHISTAKILSAMKNLEDTSSHEPRTSDKRVVTGLTNLGNTCYMNSVIQCLAATSQLIDFLIPQSREIDLRESNKSYTQHINLSNKLGTRGVVTKTLVELLFKMVQKDGSFVTPTSFKRIIGQYSPGKQFAGFEQQDCIEFLTFILDSLHEDLNQALITDLVSKATILELSLTQEKARENLPIRLASTIEWERYLKLNFSVIVDFFQGQYLSQLKCLVCHTTSTTYNSFTILSLPIPEPLRDNSRPTLLYDCLNLFVETELLADENKWHCPRCNELRNLTKKITITRLPRVLIFHFKRFKFQGTVFKKVERLVTYPISEKLDMTPYWPPIGTFSNERDSQSMTLAREKEVLATMPVRSQKPPFCYKLYGVINHYGSLTTGHYTSFVNKRSSADLVDDWCYFDDAKVSHHSREEKVMNTNAYCLFYRRI